MEPAIVESLYFRHNYLHSILET